MTKGIYYQPKMSRTERAFRRSVLELAKALNESEWGGLNYHLEVSRSLRIALTQLLGPMYKYKFWTAWELLQGDRDRKPTALAIENFIANIHWAEIENSETHLESYAWVEFSEMIRTLERFHNKNGHFPLVYDLNFHFGIGHKLQKVENRDLGYNQFRGLEEAIIAVEFPHQLIENYYGDRIPHPVFQPALLAIMDRAANLAERMNDELQRRIDKSFQIANR